MPYLQDAGSHFISDCGCAYTDLHESYTLCSNSLVQPCSASAGGTKMDPVQSIPFCFTCLALIIGLVKKFYLSTSYFVPLEILNFRILQLEHFTHIYLIYKGKLQKILRGGGGGEQPKKQQN